jgi:hypothetical protein
MKSIALVVLIICSMWNMLQAAETEDRIKTHEKRDANAVHNIPYKTYAIDKKYTPTQRVEYARDTIALIDEDFETGMPAGWTVIDGNNDGYTWTTGTTFDLLYVQPPNYGTAYAYYSDDDAGGGAPAGTEYLISPAVSCAAATIMTLSHSWGHNLMGLYIYGTTQVRLHDGISWDPWSTLATYPYTANGVDTFHLDSYLPAESVQVQFTYEDPLGEWSFAFGIDNVLLEANIPLFYVWDFEDGWQGWTHTNLYAFPQAWDVIWSDLHGPTWQVPASGDSSMWIDADAAGGVTSDSALSPVIVPPWNLQWLVYAYCNNGGSGSFVNDLYVGIKYLSGSVWNIAELIHYPGGAISGPAWDSLDVSAYASADSIQVYVYFTDNNTWGYWAAFDNVGLYAPLEHDVGCLTVVSPPEGPAPPDHYDIIGYICNLGANAETFDVRATVYDTNSWFTIFDSTLTLTNFPAGGSTNLTIGNLWFGPDTVYYTEIYTLLGDDMNPSNDTSMTYTNVVGATWQYEIDVTAATGDNACTGIEFDGTYFYITGANNGIYPKKVYVVDTLGNLVWSLDQPAHVTGSGWRNIWWDYSFSGPSGIEYLYAMYSGNLEQFSIDLQGGALTYHGLFPLPSFLPYVTSIVYMPDSEWYFTPAQNTIYKWTWLGIIQTAPNPGYEIYDGAYDTDPSDGGWVWWHSQDDPGTGFDCLISQMDALTMNFTGYFFGYSLPIGIADGIAGGICFYEGFRNHDMLFVLIQGTPHDYIVGVPLREHVGVLEKPSSPIYESFGFSANNPNPITGMAAISFTTTAPGRISLKVYDAIGRLVYILLEDYEHAGLKTIHWDGRDDNQRRVANGCYFIKLEAGDDVDVQKIILIE